MNTEKKEDRRVRYTKKAIKDSFLQLLEQKPIEKISVTEICRDADINRGTFYSHYNDPFDLKEKLVQELVESMKKHVMPDGSGRIRFVDSLVVLREERDLCRIFAGENGDTEALSRIIRVQTDTWLDHEYMQAVSALPETRKTAVKLMAISAVTTVVKVWIDYGMQADPEIVADTMSRFVTGALTAFIPEA